MIKEIVKIDSELSDEILEYYKNRDSQVETEALEKIQKIKSLIKISFKKPISDEDYDRLVYITQRWNSFLVLCGMTRIFPIIPLQISLEKELKAKGRKTIQGTVISNKMDKTAVILVERTVIHPRYKKRMKESKKYHIHDSTNSLKPGDKVKAMECRPLSKKKRFRLIEITGYNPNHIMQKRYGTQSSRRLHQRSLMECASHTITE